MQNKKKNNTNGKSKSSNSQKKSKSQKINNRLLLETFFIDSLKDIYWAEKLLTKTLPKMAKAATTEELAEGFLSHAKETEEHVTRLEEIFKLLDKKAQAQKCDAMEGLKKEGEKILEETEKNTFTRDAALIIAAQKVEHYEIATYGSLVQLSLTLGKRDVAYILNQTLQEEKDTDKKLTALAENHINEEALLESDLEEKENEKINKAS
jgi:ferritin-like metal-binding protein YciE